MESLGERRKRKASSSSSTIDETPPRKPRRSGHDALEFIPANCEEKRKQREEEVQLRREEIRRKTEVKRDLKYYDLAQYLNVFKIDF